MELDDQLADVDLFFSVTVLGLQVFDLLFDHLTELVFRPGNRKVLFWNYLLTIIKSFFYFFVSN